MVLFGILTLLAILALFLFLKLIFSWWISPILRNRMLHRCGFQGPPPNFPFGNVLEMKKKNGFHSSFGSSKLTHDIHSFVFPYFSRWQNSHGKVFIYWLGTEPFLYIADPEFLKKMSTEVIAKRWGKPNVFKNDREPMFGKGLVMAEGNEWVYHRHLIAPTFSPLNLKEMSSMMVESTKKMMDRWITRINPGGNLEIDIEREIFATSGEIIASTSMGIDDENARTICEKLRTLKMRLFKTRYVGVPFIEFIDIKRTIEAKKLGKEIDKLLLCIIETRKESKVERKGRVDLLDLLLDENENYGKRLSTKQLVDECKTFFFAGLDTSALAISWTLMLLAMNEDWQNQLRDEIKDVVGDKEVDINVIAGLKKMKCVMNEVLRLYPSAPNLQRQAREDIKFGNLTIPNGTNMWIDVVAMHHDPLLWGENVNEFQPERFMGDINGGCNQKMGYLPFGFGGRMCLGRNLSFMEHKIVLTLLLSRFRFKMSPTYIHSPSIMLSLRPAYGLPLIVQSI
ncbi:cytokinin hydroxylase-like [Trifolium pratense]|uniref:cytokinin hydroxylase-like n=1 Tax=Trifolium pratense TaxID=57577 RepID=UPI001E693DE0|nr:cytokinin hydroxylase-like [Trifolium pratense]